MPELEFETLLLSPNLGCPHLLTVEELAADERLTVLFAMKLPPGVQPLRDAFADRLFLRPSYHREADAGREGWLPLATAGPARELTDWSLLREIRDAQDTRRLLPDELHRLLGEQTRYFEVTWALPDDATRAALTAQLRPRGGDGPATRLCDLIWLDEGGARKHVNPHAVHVSEGPLAELRLLHATDLHVSRRNDQILDEVCKEKCERSRNEIQHDYCNYNENVRDFIRDANARAARGELDAVVITGDLVDFAHHGWRDDACLWENNWQTFHDLITGQGREAERGNDGLQVPLYTTLGNHDWRLHPYSLTLGKYYKKLNLRKDEAKHYDYKGFDARELPKGSPRRNQVEDLEAAALKTFNLDLLEEKGRVWLAARLSGWLRSVWSRAGSGVGVSAAATSAVHGGTGVFGDHWIALLSGVVGALVVWVLVELLRLYLGKFLQYVVDNPLHADALALHPYFLHFSPYFDLATRVGPHWLILMDTGSDVFVGQVLDHKEYPQLKKMSIEDNILGGSPDSRAFDSDQRHYAWSQIVWLEKVLEAAGADGDSERVLLFLHAPPINTHLGNEKLQRRYGETQRSRKGGAAYVTREDLNLTYGACRYYLSQFFYLCLGTRESDLGQPPAPALASVDLVCCGHAHRNVEFRVALEGEQVRLFTDRYSEQLGATQEPAPWWEQHRPVVVQTAAVGLPGSDDEKPPYRREVHVDPQGVIQSLAVLDETQLEPRV